MSAEQNLLFVYGTLLTRARGSLGTDMRARLKAASTSLGEATIPGRLFDMDTFPVMIEPSAPTATPGCSTQRSPTATELHSVTLATSRVSAPIVTSSRSTQPGPIVQRAPMRARAPITASGPMAADGSITALESITALGCRPGMTGGAGCSSAAIRA